MKPGRYPCSTDLERESWHKHVVKDWLKDTFRYLYPRAENVVTWAPTILHRVRREGLLIDLIYCSNDLLQYLRGVNIYGTSYGFAHL